MANFKSKSVSPSESAIELEEPKPLSAERYPKAHTAESMARGSTFTRPVEGGFEGWLCVAGCFLGLFATFGFLNAIGVFQTTYQAGTLRNYTSSDIAWIFAVQLCLMWLPGPLFGRIVDTYGPRPVMIPCSLLCVFSLCMTSLSKEYYQIFLAQGIGFGIGAGGVFTTCLICTSQWFIRQRGLAVGIATCGSSLGGVIFPIFVDRIMASVGFYGAVRYAALLVGTCLVGACVLVKARLPTTKWNHDLKWFNFGLFADKAFALYTIGSYLVMWSLWSPFDYLPSMAVATGFSPTLAFYLISIINASSIPGRIIPPHLGDMYGYFNVMTVVSFSTGISVIALWLPFDYHHSHAGIIVFALVYGFFSGAFVSLLVPCAAKSGSLETLGQRFGTFQTIISVSCLTGLPIHGALLGKQHNQSFVRLQIFAASTMIVGSVCIGASRFVLANTHKVSRI